MPTCKRFGADVGLDAGRFNACVDSGRYVDRVNAETEAGRLKGVEAIPTLFVNGQKRVGLPTFDELLQLVGTAPVGKS